MSLTKEFAYKALASHIRSKYGFTYDESYMVQKDQLQDYKYSSEEPYARFAESFMKESLGRSGHPDYDHLAEEGNIGNTEEGTITAFFMDLKNFTKYCKFLPPEKVYRAKAAAIEAVIAVCRMYSGYLHEIPGDGVLMYFGGKSKDSTESARLAIFAGCDSMHFLETLVIPEYSDVDNYPSIFPKMGIDYGPALWAAYGANPDYEVKATSFNVDIASKMMSACNAKQIRIGNDIKTHLEIDPEFLGERWNYTRDLTIAGETKHLDYATWIFNWEKFSDKHIKSSIDLSQLWTGIPNINVTTSETKLGDAPLA